MESQIRATPRYVCPRTQRELSLKGSMLTCMGGLHSYPVTNGMPNFLRFPPAEDAATEEQLLTLNRLAAVKGWRAALDDVYGMKSSMVQYVTDSERTSYINLLPLTKNSDVLEIGPGLGQLTTILGHRASTVAALEVVRGQAEFARERCRQDGLTNVQFVVGGDDCRIPFAPNSFDVVVLNLVFEWCATRCVDEPHSAAQMRILDEIFRVLKPGGVLYLATKNRFALHYIIGKRDEHFFNIPFGSALPHWFARWILKLNGFGRPPGMLYSHDDLRSMLRKAGFEIIKSLWAAPEMRHPTQYIPTDAHSVRIARSQPGFVQGHMRSTRILMRFVPAAFIRHFTPGLTFLAKKPV